MDPEDYTCNQAIISIYATQKQRREQAWVTERNSETVLTFG
jgi:hypothetical protein